MGIPRYMCFPASGWTAYLILKVKVEGWHLSGDDLVDIPGLPGALASETPWTFFPMIDLDKSAGSLVNNCEELESDLNDGMADYLQRFATLQQTKVGKYFSIGYLTPPETSHLSSCMNTIGGRRSEALEWLDEQQASHGAGAGSVLYISFGTVSEPTAELIYELARGLELSGTRFLWVVRPPSPADELDTLLPRGFLANTRGRGLVLMGFVPQISILEHPSIGTFLSHCGWNSTMEAMFAGVPILAWPINGDQPINARFIVDVLKAGLHVTTRRFTPDRVVVGEEVAKAIQSLMSGEKGKEVKINAIKWKAKTQASSKEDGSSRRHFQRFIDEILVQ